MGMDISAYAEVRTDGKWEPLYGMTRVEYEEDFVRHEMKQVYSERNYVLFERLTGEFHHWVDACPTPLSTPKSDIPEDASDAMKLVWSDDRDRWDGDWFHVLTLAELQTVDWDQYLAEIMGDGKEAREAQVAWSDAMGLMGRIGAPDDVRMLFWFTP
jgi:hypothetical protein